MLRSLGGNVYKRLMKVFTPDLVAVLPKTNIPRARGEFNVYEAFPVAQPWYRYSVIKDEDLSTWERIDKAAVLMWRKSLRYEQFGLLYDDIIGDETPMIIEAVNRLPKAVKEARERRITRAFDLSANQKRLPKEEWTKFEEDVSYLKPYIAWVQSEWDEYDAETMTRENVPLPWHYKWSTGDYEGQKIFKRRFVD